MRAACNRKVDLVHRSIFLHKFIEPVGIDARIDLTELIAREQGIEVDLEAFEKELQAQKERSRNAAAVSADDWHELLPIRESEFVGYDTLSERVRIARYRSVQSKGKTSYQLVFDRTPFYGNSGGQIGDIGYIEQEGDRIPVVATEKEIGRAHV